MRNCTIQVVKTKVLISCAVIAQLICAFGLNMQIAGFLMQRIIYFSVRRDAGKNKLLQKSAKRETAHN